VIDDKDMNYLNNLTDLVDLSQPNVRR
jgi:hypothetical protein